MTKTRQVDEFGNVSYAIRNDGGTEAGQILKTCGGWRAEMPDGNWCPVRSVRAGMEWLAWIAKELEVVR